MPATRLASTTAATPLVGPERITYGAVHLDVTDLDRSAAFWRDTLGLEAIAEAPGALQLGVAGRALVVLHGGATRPVGRGHAGLYHLAIHLPDAVEFARVISRLADRRVRQSPTDHVFSKATYLDDPDGIMLEITLETPERYGSIDEARAVVYDSDGVAHGGTEPLDMRATLAPLGDAPLDAPLAAGSFIGHVHLHVPDLAGAYAFYGDVVGFTEHSLLHTIGMADLGAGGAFPHRIALNVWHGPDARQPAAGTAGMRHVELRVADQEALAGVAARAGATVDADGALRILDPAGNRLELRA
jgi:catechol 2,3-dioxygenase